jgi:hypothetical protein
MSSFTKNFEYQGPSMPSYTICPPELNEHITIRRLTATADVASLLTAGVLCTLTAGTNVNDMTPSIKEAGYLSTASKLYAVEIQEHNPYFATTTDLTEFPNRMPNASVTLANYAPAENATIIIIPVEIGMRIWLVIANAVNATVTKDTVYTCIANGLVGAQDDVSPDALVYMSHGFRAVATATNENWGLFEYIGMIGIDST